MKKVVIVTDAWEPQINGVVRTLKATRAELIQMGYDVQMIIPNDFLTLPCPTYAEIRLSLFPYRKVARRLETLRSAGEFALHIATEGPLGWAARRYALKHRLLFNTAYHTRFPEYVYARFRIPLSWTYRYLHRFHHHSRHVLAPTQSIVDALHQRGFNQAVLWSRGVDTTLFYPRDVIEKLLPAPSFLCVGRVAVEKNLDAFLSLDLPGNKWVVGDGPALTELKHRYPDVHFLGRKTQDALAEIYSAADVFVFPSITDTFGLVLLEALACGTPVAAYPVAGPIDVIGAQPIGALDKDLRAACLAALKIADKDTMTCVDYAHRFSWRRCTEAFAQYLQWNESFIANTEK